MTVSIMMLAGLVTADPYRSGLVQAEFPEMRASIIDREGDQFIAQTEEGHQFRLPVEGAPADVNVGDSLRLVPDADTQTIQVFKADPTEDGSGPAPGVQL